ncbi:carboxymuconolactone decarboxylase family protein [Nocardia sp. BMG111209]|uniref:carboxymuconolactone decarboxylase family protein n=1 Tax=Nocardia sp. BMG111209 TaxID=1160137 RepID=UPI0003734B55|nr:carboxymuconolactone decarboxylase family protein [Nocardia sp. BMG111209]
MPARIPDANALVPEIQEVAAALVRAVGNGSVPENTTTLMFLRAGQIVGNSYQVTRHTAGLRAAGESEDRLATVVTWWDSPYFSEAERAALALTEAVFGPTPPGAERVPDDLFATVARHYDEKAQATLAVVLASAGFWMNIAVVLKPPAIVQPATAA